MINNPIKPQSKELSLEKIRIISHLMFDGTLFESSYHYTLRYINSSRKLINQFVEDMKKVYGLSPSSFERITGKNMDTFKVTFLSKEAYTDLLKYSPSYSTSNPETSIPKEILSGNKENKIEFLKSFWEDEGSISSTGRIMGDLCSEQVINQIILLQKELGIPFKSCTYKKDKILTYKIYTPKSYETLCKFLNLDLFGDSIITHGKNLGKRKREVLKEHIEKLKNHT